MACRMSIGITSLQRRWEAATLYNGCPYFLFYHIRPNFGKSGTPPPPALRQSQGKVARCKASVNSRAKTPLAQLQTVRVMPASSACRGLPASAWLGNPSQGFPHTPSCAFGRILRARPWGAAPNPATFEKVDETFLALRVRHKAKSCAVKRRSLAGKNIPNAITKIARHACKLSLPGAPRRVMRPGSACRGLPRLSLVGEPLPVLLEGYYGQDLGALPQTPPPLKRWTKLF